MQSYSPQNPLKLGTRGSPLALAQAEDVKARICSAHKLGEDCVEIHTMKTTGDQFTDRPLSAIGGKGLFTKELEQGLYSGEIDIAVHSMKDVATILPDGLMLSSVLEREDCRDAFVSEKYGSIAELPNGAIIGTSSLRRKAQILRQRPDLKIVEFRGLVETRLQKLRDGVADATFLATAGLNRLGRMDLFESGIAHIIDDKDMLPAAAQGAVGIEIRKEDVLLHRFLKPLHHVDTYVAIIAERAFLRELDGSCRTPIAALANVENDKIIMRGQVLSLDGAKFIEGSWKGSDPEALGTQAGLELLSKGAADVLG